MTEFMNVEVAFRDPNHGSVSSMSFEFGDNFGGICDKFVQHAKFLQNCNGNRTSFTRFAAITHLWNTGKFSTVVLFAV